MSLSKSNLLPVVLVLLLLASCGEDHALKKETFLLQKKNMVWLPSDTTGNTWWVRDNNGITISYTKAGEDHSLNKSWSSILGINTKMSFNEYYYKVYRSSFGDEFHISLTAGFPPYGDELYLEIDGLGFAYDFGYKTVSRITCAYGYLSKTQTDKGYEENIPILSTVELADSLVTQEKTYQDVLHFSFRDFTDQWQPYQITEIWLAGKTGLVRYDLANGMWYERVSR